MRSKIQEETLSGKSAFKKWYAKFGVIINRYQKDNGIFAEKPFRSAIKDSNQTITFCGVGYHNKMSFLKKIQTITLGDITLLILKRNKLD